MSKPSDQEQRAFKRITHTEQPYIHDVDENGYMEQRESLKMGCPFAMLLMMSTILLCREGWMLL